MLVNFTVSYSHQSLIIGKYHKHMVAYDKTMFKALYQLSCIERNATFLTAFGEKKIYSSMIRKRFRLAIEETLSNQKISLTTIVQEFFSSYLELHISINAFG